MPKAPPISKDQVTIWLRRLAPVIALGVLVVLVIVCRGAFLRFQPLFNPDEAELLATGRRAALGLTPWQARLCARTIEVS